MFNKQPSKIEAPASAVLTSAQSTDDVVIHTMPREFYGSEASLADTAPSVPPINGGVTPPAPPTPPPVVLPPSDAHSPLKAKRSMKGLVIMAVVCLIVLGTGAFAAFRIVESVKEQKRLAEIELDKLKTEQENDAREQAAERERQAAIAATPTPAKDTDSDGLTDIEELLYGTNFREPDSDKDSFLDGNEVFHRYHPLGLAPSTLYDTGAVKIFEDDRYPFSIYYPSTWSIVYDETTTAVTFRSARQATIEVDWTEKDTDQTLAEWFNEKSANGNADNLKQILTKEGHYGLTTSDDRTSYLDMGTAVITLQYDLGSRTQIEYLQTFQMMVNSLTAIIIAPSISPITGGGTSADQEIAS